MLHYYYFLLLFLHSTVIHNTTNAMETNC